MDKTRTSGHISDKISMDEVVFNAIESTLLKIAANSTEEILDIQGASEFLKESPKTIYKKVSQRKIPFVKEGGLLKFFKSDLIAWLKTFRVKPIDELIKEAELQTLLSNQKRE